MTDAVKACSSFDVQPNATFNLDESKFDTTASNVFVMVTSFVLCSTVGIRANTAYPLMAKDFEPSSGCATIPRLDSVALECTNSSCGVDEETFATSLTFSVLVKNESVDGLPAAMYPSLAAHRMRAALVDLESGSYATTPCTFRRKRSSSPVKLWRYVKLNEML